VVSCGRAALAEAVLRRRADVRLGAAAAACGLHREAEEATLSTWSERPRRAAWSCNGVVQPCGTELRRRAGVWREGMEWPCTFADDTNQ
jgi:hypothetical protein